MYNPCKTSDTVPKLPLHFIPKDFSVCRTCVINNVKFNQVMKLQREKVKRERESQAERLRAEAERAELDKVREEEEK